MYRPSTETGIYLLKVLKTSLTEDILHRHEYNWGSRFWLAIQCGLDTNSSQNLCASCLMDFLFKIKY